MIPARALRRWPVKHSRHCAVSLIAPPHHATPANGVASPITVPRVLPRRSHDTGGPEPETGIPAEQASRLTVEELPTPLRQSVAINQPRRNMLGRTPILCYRPSMKNPGIQYIQTRLREYGNTLDVDGIWGDKTKKAFDLALPGKAWPLDQVEPSNLSPSQEAVEIIKAHESLRLNAYPDPGSRDGLPVTIGWGSTYDEDGRPIKLGDVWTKERADRVFNMVLAKKADEVRDALKGAPTTQGQFDAMVSLAYNIGITAFKSSTLLKNHLAGDYAGAASQFSRWVYNDSRKMNGLVKRRKVEAAMYAS